MHFEFLQQVRKPGEAPHYERYRLVPTPTDEAMMLTQAAAVDAAIRRTSSAPAAGSASAAACKRSNLLPNIGHLPAKASSGAVSRLVYPVLA